MGDDETHRVVGGIALDDCVVRGIEMDKDWGSGECGFERLEGLLSSGIPPERDVLSGESGQGHDDFGVVVDEATLEIGESKKRLDVTNGARCGPFVYDASLLGIHGKTVGSDDEAQIFDLGGMEGGFVEAGMEIVVA